VGIERVGEIHAFASHRKLRESATETILASAQAKVKSEKFVGVRKGYGVRPMVTWVRGKPASVQEQVW